MKNQETTLNRANTVNHAGQNALNSTALSAQANALNVLSNEYARELTRRLCVAVKGNKTAAKEMLADTIKEQEDILNAALQERLEAIASGKPVGVLFADFIENDWLAAVRRGDRKANKRKVEQSTFGGYQLNVQTWIAPYFRERGILLTQLTADDINDFYDFHYERGVVGQTVLKYHANIVSSLKYASRKEYIESAESILKNVDRPDAEEYVSKPYSESEAMALIEAVRGHKLELGVILGAFYGLRRSEIVGLRWEAINFDANTISIERTVTQTYVDGKRIIDDKKRGKSRSSLRTLPLIPAMRAKLLAVKAEQEQHRKLFGNCWKKKYDGFIYTDPDGERIKPDYITATFPKFLEQNELRRIRFHDLRHTSACLLLDAGVPLTAIKEVIVGNSIDIRHSANFETV